VPPALRNSRSLIVAALLSDLRASAHATVSCDHLPQSLQSVGAAASTLVGGCSEAERMQAAYALSLHARGADATAAASLCSILRDTDVALGDTSCNRRVGFNGLSPVQRAAMHGLAAAGGQAVQPLVMLIHELRRDLGNDEGGDELPFQAWVVANAAIFSLGEAAASPTATAAALNDATYKLLELLPWATAVATAERGPLVEGDRASGGRPRPGQSMGRLLHATLLRSLAVLGQAAVARLPTSLALVETLLVDAVMPTLAAKEPGGEYNNTRCQVSLHTAC
jgi:hypothetical protein